MKRIPNLNSHSTLIDRLIIETVKKCQFQVKLENEEKEEAKKELKFKIKVQEALIDDIKILCVEDFFKMMTDKNYQRHSEKRTFDL